MIFVVWRYVRDLNANAWFVAGLYLRLLPWCLPTAARIGTGPVGLVLGSRGGWIFRFACGGGKLVTFADTLF